MVSDVNLEFIADVMFMDYLILDFEIWMSWTLGYFVC